MNPTALVVNVVCGKSSVTPRNLAVTRAMPSLKPSGILATNLPVGTELASFCRETRKRDPEACFSPQDYAKLPVKLASLTQSEVVQNVGYRNILKGRHFAQLSGAASPFKGGTGSALQRSEHETIP